MKTLHQKTAIVTGASRGIGLFIAEALAKKGMNLVLAARSLSKLQEVEGKLLRYNTSITCIQTDVLKNQDLDNLIQHAFEKYKSIEVLVNNAGIERTLPYHVIKSDDIEQVIRINLIAPMHLSNLVLPIMLLNRRGHIVNISSLAGKIPPPFSGPYAASKAGLIGFTHSLRAEYRHLGISSSVICPGFINTTGMYANALNHLNPRHMLGSSSPADVAHAVIRSIIQDVPEIIVNPGLIRLAIALSEIYPSIKEFLLRKSGVWKLFQEGAHLRENVFNKNRDGKH